VQYAVFTEADILVSEKLKRFERLTMICWRSALSPRFSMAYKVAKNSQFSTLRLSKPTVDYIKLFKNYLVESENYITFFNFQYSKENQTFD
jgi:hypothetical protein